MTAIRLLAVLVAVLIPAVRVDAQQPPVRRDTLSDSARTRAQVRTELAREARNEARRRMQSDSLSIRRRGEEAAPTAFADPLARDILERARVARVTQDSALVAYRAKATQRITVKLGLRRVGFEKLLFQGDNVSMVSWQRGVGVWMKPIGSRMTIPMADVAEGDFYEAVSVPYFPGREQLWFPSSDMGMVRSDINEREMIHPIARGSEAYYRYATGDSISIRLPDGKTIRIRELKVSARKPEWRLFVGSFWFDTETGQLVRAAYRWAVDLEIWDVASEDSQQEAQFNKAYEVIRDSIMRAQLPRDEYVKDSIAMASRSGNNDDDPPAFVKAMIRPAKARLDAITVEYGLYRGRFWLPRNNSATAYAQVGFMRMPVEINEKYEYELVNGDMSLPPLPAERIVRNTTGTDTVVIRDGSISVGATIGGKQDSAAIAQRRAVNDSIRLAARGVKCPRDSTYTRTNSRYNGALRIAYEVPCSSQKLQNSPELAPVDMSNALIFDEQIKEDLLKMLDLDLQPVWAPEMPKVRTGLDMVRYNRVEGLSVGLIGTQRLGSGYGLSAQARFGHADLHLNGEFSAERSNGRRTVRATGYHRLSAVNPEWAGALTWGASLPALMYTRDEGFYYRNFGFELVDRREKIGRAVDYKLFVERQWTAGDTGVVNTFSIGSALSDRRFLPNIIAEPVSLAGGAIDFAGSVSPGLGTTLLSAVRAEAATGTFAYGRLASDLTLSRPIGPVAASLMASGGYSAGRVPVQRLWYMGGLRTVRGQIAGTQSGDSYWLARAEVGTRFGIIRPVTFFDIGWAGSRDAIGKTQPQRGAGIGVSLLDGLLRMDFSRGLYPNKRWRTDLYLQAQL